MRAWLERLGVEAWHTRSEGRFDSQLLQSSPEPQNDHLRPPEFPCLCGVSASREICRHHVSVLEFFEILLGVRLGARTILKRRPDERSRPSIRCQSFVRAGRMSVRCFALKSQNTHTLTRKQGQSNTKTGECQDDRRRAPRPGLHCAHDLVRASAQYCRRVVRAAVLQGRNSLGPRRGPRGHGPPPWEIDGCELYIHTHR